MPRVSRSSTRTSATSLTLLALAAAGLAACGGDKGSGTAQATPAPASAATAAAPAADQGQQAYQRCAVCHQANGMGVPGSFPPLAGSEWANADNAAVPIRIVLRGLQGPITVKGQRYNSAMPAYGTAQPMTDAEVAAVLTFVRSSWGNKGSAVTAEQVATEKTAIASHSGAWLAKDLQPLLTAAH